MPKIYYDADADLAVIRGRKVAILGYGSQGHAHALNLRDSGWDVRVGLHAGASRARKRRPTAWSSTTRRCVRVGRRDHGARARHGPGSPLPGGHSPEPDCRKHADVRARIQRSVWDARPAQGHRRVDDCAEVARPPRPRAVSGRCRHARAAGNPSGRERQGEGSRALVREGHRRHPGRGHRDHVAEETETDLFGEQTVLCGGVSALVKAAFETLVEAGYQPEIAYFECMHELKLIVDLMYQGGLNYMRYSVSDTAEHGDYTGGPRIITDETRKEMRKMLAEIQDGTYARNWIEEDRKGRPWFNAQREKEQSQKLEEVGARLRVDAVPEAGEAPAAGRR